MYGPLDALTEKLSVYAQNLFQVPNALWMETIQPDVVNPVAQFEQTLNDILGQQRMQDRPVVEPQIGHPSTSVPGGTGRAGFTSAAKPHRALTAPSGFNSPGRTTHPKNANTALRSSDLGSSKKTPADSTAQFQPDPVRSSLGVSASAYAPQQSPDPDPGPTQSTRLLKRVDELQTLFRAVTQQNPEVTDTGTTVDQTLNRPATISDIKNPGAGNPVEESEATKHIQGRNETSIANFYESALQNFPQSQEPHAAWTDNRNFQQSPSREKDAQTPTFTRLKTTPGKHSGAIKNDPFTAPDMVKNDRPSGVGPQSHIEPLLQSRTANTEDNLHAQILSVIASLDSDVQDLLLEQLLDRLEDRQRELIMRSLGFTGGQI